ncbi:Regulator of drug sensitivity 2 [Talaromyces islandicus]|uniref:Regulator of drug sensitivity 2 n=1 Tax=Talaromyces islandicus TaxID=28573 RepID=A0A0U1M056_TALIS|nr:Regulator of drug sensitivity 2 [Talaromyces islandicus]
MTGKTAADSSAPTDNTTGINIKAAPDSSLHLRDASSNSSDQTPSAAKTDTNGQAHASPKKRRKVNHACVYCRRSHMTCDSERPCTRCIKRNIGHLCHDEPREPTKKGRNEHEEEGVATNDFGASHGMSDIARQPMLSDSPLSIRPSTIDPSQTVQPSSISNPAGPSLDANPQQIFSYGDWPVNGQSQFQDMHTFHPSYMFNAPEVTDEYNLLGDFLSNSLLDDNAMYGNDEPQGLYSDSSLINMTTNLAGNSQAFNQQQQKLAQLASTQNMNAQSSVQGSGSTIPNDKARENYYMTAADPSGMDPPEERMNKLLKAKYEAGMLRPFNYVKGYARLNQYMEQHMQPALRHKILRQLDKFRPKFRERMQSLTDIELVLSEMWFERSLMEYDRVFASMAIPACCWRRTGEIFRGNKEMAELINVPIENLRDGKLALHQIITEDQLVSYWEKFGAIAFDGTQKAMLTSSFNHCIVAMEASNMRDPNEIAVSICEFVADLLSHIEDPQSFTSWIQKDGIATSLEHFLSALVLRKPSTLSARSRNLLAVDMTEKVSNMLQQAASAINALQASGSIDKEVEVSIAKYHLLRATVAVKDRNLELTESELSQISENSMKVDPEIGEQYVILCHTALRQTLENMEAADNWLTRIFNQRIPHLSWIFEAVELYHQKDPLMLVLQLEFMSKQKTPHLRIFHEALMKHIDITEPSVLNFKSSVEVFGLFEDAGECDKHSQQHPAALTEKTPDGDESIQPNLNLYRIAVQLIVLEIREHDEPVLHGRLCRLFSRAVELFRYQDFELNDLNWFSRCSYLASLELFDKIDGLQVLSMLDISLKVELFLAVHFGLSY